MPNLKIYPNINFLSSSGITFNPTTSSISGESGYRFEAFDNGTLNIYKKNLTGVGSEYILNISSSNKEPRIGFGFEPTEKFSKSFEIKSSRDSADGTELSLKSSRITQGGIVGDSAGKINFVIASGSFIKGDISGSIADIKAEIKTVSDEGASGDLVFSIAQTNKDAPIETFRISRDESTFTNKITAKNDVSASGNVYGANLFGNVIGTSFFPVNGVAFNNEVTFFTAATQDVFGNTVLEETSSADFKFFRQGEGIYLNNSALELTGSLVITGSTTITGPLTITGSQLITDDITSDGTIRARVKSFDIPHPTRKNKRLVYGALEGPEHGIYCRGESKELKVLLPPEWRAMVNTKEVTVQITPIGEWQPLYFKKLHSNWLYFGCGDEREKVHFYWEIKGERTDVPKLQTVQ
jgi:hypothetical protein